MEAQTLLKPRRGRGGLALAPFWEDNAKGRVKGGSEVEARRFTPAGLSLTRVAHGASGEPFDPTFLGADGTTIEPA